MSFQYSVPAETCAGSSDTFKADKRESQITDGSLGVGATGAAYANGMRRGGARFGVGVGVNSCATLKSFGDGGSEKFAALFNGTWTASRTMYESVALAFFAPVFFTINV